LPSVKLRYSPPVPSEDVLRVSFMAIPDPGVAPVRVVVAPVSAKAARTLGPG
jgi:hypothetical protein